MTKHLSIFLALLMLSTATTVKASTLYYVVDGIRYAVNTGDSTAQVVNYGTYKTRPEIKIPASITADGVSYPVTSIEDYCFMDCATLTDVTIPNSVTSIGTGCFRECSSLTTVKLPEGIKELKGAFYHCSSLKSVTIPSSVTNLAPCFTNDGACLGCFEGCTSLESITLPSSLTSLGEN